MFQSSWTSFCVTFITGVPGSGKSYCCVKDLYERLKEHEGPVVTNLPINVETFSEAVAKATGRELESVKAQLHLLSREILTAWKEGEWAPDQLAKNPADYLGLETVKGALFILDECHLFCPVSDPSRQKLWSSWLGEVRHEGWVGVYFVSQDQSKVGNAIKQHAELRYELTKADKLRDPWLKIELGLWAELVASFTGAYAVAVQIVQFRKMMGKMVSEHTNIVRLDPFYFELYHSFAATGGGSSGEGSTAQQLEHEKRPRWWFTERNGRPYAPVWVWFLGRTWGRLSWRIAVVILFSWFCFFGGFAWMIHGWMNVVSRAVSSATTFKVEDFQTVGAESSEGSGPSPVATRETELSPSSALLVAEALKELPEEKRALVLDHMTQLAAGLDEERAKLEEKKQAEKEKESKRKKREAVRVVAIDNRRIWLSDGTEVIEGEAILGGLFDGETVKEVDRWRRRVTFGDGLVIGMGSVPSGVSESAEPSDGRGNEKPAGRASPFSQPPIPRSLPGSIIKGAAAEDI